MQGVELDAGLAADMLEKAADWARRPPREATLNEAIDTAQAAVDLLLRTRDRLAIAKGRGGVP